MYDGDGQGRREEGPNSELFAAAAEIRYEADALRAASGALPVLGQVGEVRFVGGYAMDVMVRRDIDLYVIDVAGVPDLERVLATQAALMRLMFFRAVLFYDFARFPRVGFPAAHYLGLKAPVGTGDAHGPGEWKIDIGFLPAMPAEAERLIEAVRGLDAERKGLILRIKHALMAAHIEVPSVRVYEAVLAGVVGSVDEFFAYVGIRGR